jgi:Domain of unknown function (DUF4145)
MAEINDEGSIRARCPGCHGALSTFEWRTALGQHGAITVPHKHRYWSNVQLDYRLFKCAGCGRGGLGVIAYPDKYPGSYRDLYSFYPEVRDRLPFPKAVPNGIAKEFREGEKCMDSGTIRAAAGMFRSVLDKTLRANGYKLKNGTTLEQQIDLAADDGVITQARKRRAHDEIRVLGNDVLHDEWHEIAPEDVEAARHYAQRVLEDFYDDRESVLKLLRDAGRVPDEDNQPPAAAAT